MHMCFVLTRRPETLGETNLLFFISFLATHTFYQHSQTLAYWWGRRSERKGNYELLYLPFSFYVIIFSISHWLTQGIRTQVKKGYDRVLWLCFLEQSCLLSASETSSGCNGKHGLLGLSAPLLTPAELPHITGPLESRGPRGGKEWQQTMLMSVPPLLRLMLQCPIRFHLQNTKYKKSLRIDV